MGCCGKAVKKGKNIVKGWTAVAVGKIYEFTDDRVSKCEKCDDNQKIAHILICSICKCPIKAKSRVKDEKCPKGKWDK